jgi:superfamily I DNA/RNA helicase
MVTATVAIASEFLDAFARIPRAQQRKVREFTEKFRTDPTSAAINYEKIHAVRDDKVRTVRIDQKYRAIVLSPPQGNVFVLVWVDNHDEAMAWASKRRFEINPVTGSLQVFSITAAEETVAAEKKQKTVPGLFEEHADDVLLSFGIPAPLLPSVRSIRTSDGLLALSQHLPAEAAEALTWLAEGLPVEEIRAALTVTPPKDVVDTTDLEAALDKPDTKRRFVTIKSNDELASILNAPLDKWRVFLHPSQEKLVRKNYNGAVRVLGGPGTGKTVVAMHRARHLATQVFRETTDRILFTTYTANLSESVEQNLQQLCGDEYQRIEVINLHAWAVRFLKSQKVAVEPASDDDIEAAWNEALGIIGDSGFDVGFLQQEWEYVVQAHGISTLEEYLTVPRTGRGRTLTKPQRGKVWKIFEEYMSALKDRGKIEWLSIIRETRMYLQKQKGVLPYRAVVADEIQDFHPEDWKLLRALVAEGSNDLFLVGDAHQRIYGGKVVLKDYGINVRGRSSQLKINYRTTEQIRDWSMALLHGVHVDDLDGEIDQIKGYRSLLSGQPPEIDHFSTAEEEGKFIVGRIKSLLEQKAPEDICMVTRSKKLLTDQYQPLLKKAGIDSVILDKKNNPDQKGIRLGNMHRVKGLEFPVVFLASVNAGVIPSRTRKSDGDPSIKADHEEKERSLLFVAATRARDHLVVTSYGTASRFLRPDETA